MATALGFPNSLDLSRVVGGFLGVFGYHPCGESHLLLKLFFFGLGEDQGTLVNNDCSSWYHGVGKFFFGAMFGIGESKVSMVVDRCVRTVVTTSLQSAKPVAVSILVILSVDDRCQPS